MGEHLRPGPRYLEGWLGNEAVEITNRGGDIHRNGPLLLRWGLGRFWGGNSCGRFLEKERGVGLINIQPESSLLPPLQKMLQSSPGNQPGQPTLSGTRPFFPASTTQNYQPSTLGPPSCLLGPEEHCQERLKQCPVWDRQAVPLPHSHPHRPHPNPRAPADG